MSTYKIYPAEILKLSRCLDGDLSPVYTWLFFQSLDKHGLPNSDEEIAAIADLPLHLVQKLRPFFRYLFEEEAGLLYPIGYKKQIQRTKYLTTAAGLLSGKWANLRKIILQRDKGTCGYCGQPAVAVDHIHPRSKGGTNDPSNLVAACKSCNSRKGGRTLEQAGMIVLFCDLKGGE